MMDYYDCDIVNEVDMAIAIAEKHYTMEGKTPPITGLEFLLFRSVVTKNKLNLKDESLMDYWIYTIKIISQLISISTKESLKYIVENKGRDPITYEGGCIEFVEEFYKQFRNRLEKAPQELQDIINRVEPKLKDYHGELQHSLDVPRDMWDVQHHVISIKLNDIGTLYIDPTNVQFKKYGVDIGGIYTIGIPKYFLPDENNWRIKFLMKHKLYKFIQNFEYHTKGLIGKWYLKTKENFKYLPWF